MRNQELLTALRRTAQKKKRLIVVIHKGIAPLELTPEQAIKLVADRPEYLGFGSHSRIKRIEWHSAASRELPVDEDCWSVARSAVIRFHGTPKLRAA